MDPQNQRRCPHYQIVSERLELEGPSAYLAIRRCTLTERLIRLISIAPGGRLLTDRLVVSTSPTKTYAFAGPDLDAVTQNSCTTGRCEDQCTPAYVQHLSHFNSVDPSLEDVTCDEEESTEQKAMKETVQHK